MHSRNCYNTIIITNYLGLWNISDVFYYTSYSHSQIIITVVIVTIIYNGYIFTRVDKLRTLFFNYFFIYKISIYKIFYALKERKTKNIDFSVRVIRKIMFYVYFSDMKKKKRKIFRVCRALFWNILCTLFKWFPNSRNVYKILSITHPAFIIMIIISIIN